MLTIKQFTKYEDGIISALVANYGREYSATLDDRGVTVFGTGGQRGAAAWKVKADAKLIKEFMNEQAAWAATRHIAR